MKVVGHVDLPRNIVSSISSEKRASIFCSAVTTINNLGSKTVFRNPTEKVVIDKKAVKTAFLKIQLVKK